MQKIIILGYLCWLFICPKIFAQACFNANVVRGCAPLSITLTDCSGGANIAYKYSQAEGFVTRNTNTYPTPGKYTITQIAQIGASGDSLRKTDYIEVLPTPLPNFSVRTCANRKVSLHISDTQYEQYLVNWGDGSSQIVLKGAPPIEHTYGGTGSYSLKVKGNYVPGNCGAEKAILINPVTTLPAPTIQSLITNTRNAIAGTVVAKLLTKADFDYEIYANGNASPIASFVGTGGEVTQTIDNLNTASAQVCLQVKTLDKCGTFAVSAPIYCHMALEVVAQDSKNLLTWKPYTGAVPVGSFLQYTLYRNSQPFQILTDINLNTYTDEQLVCKENYCYQIIAEFGSANFVFTAASNTDCVNAFSTKIPPILSELNATVETTRSIQLFWKVENEPRIISYEIKRNGVSINSSSQSQALLDADLKIDKQFCYEVRYTNICDNTSVWAVKVCPVYLNTLPTEGGKPRLQWTAYQNPDNKLEAYKVQKLNDQLQVYEEVSLPPNTLAYTDATAKTDRQIMRYRIKSVISTVDNIISYSNIVEVVQRFRLFFPTAFTPDDNAKNEIFKPTFLFVKKFKMTIYNRQGEVLFETNDIEKGWDGKHKGQKVPADSYAYFAEAEDNKGEKFSTKGTFVLIK